MRRQNVIYTVFGAEITFFISLLFSRGPRLPQLFRKIQMHRLQRSSKPCRGFRKWTSHQHGGELNRWPPKPTFLIEMFYLFFCIVYLFTRAILFVVGFVPFLFFHSLFSRQPFYYNVEFQLLLETSVFFLLLQHDNELLWLTSPLPSEVTHTHCRAVVSKPF